MLSLKAEALCQLSSSKGRRRRTIGPAARPPTKAQPMRTSKDEMELASKDASPPWKPGNKSRITAALVVPTIREGIRIWDRFRIPEDARMATSPPKVRKRKITRFRPEKILIKIAPNTVVKVMEILSWFNKTSSKGRMAKGRT